MIVRALALIAVASLVTGCGQTHGTGDAGDASLDGSPPEEDAGPDASIAWRWEAAASMGFSRANRQAVVLDDGRLLFAGGEDVGTSMIVESYDPAVDAWTVVDRFRPTTVGNHTVTVLPSGEALITSGGLTRGERFQPYGIAWTACWLFDPSTDSLTMTGEMLQARSHHAAVFLDSGEVLAVGGAAPGATEGEFVVESSAELYDPATASWTEAAPLSVGRYWHTLTLLDGGEVLVAGGFDESLSETGVTEIYVVDEDRWTTTGSMDQPRQRHSTVRLATGDVLAIGGAYDWTPIASVESYSPATGEWTSVSPLPVPLAETQALVLPDGRVLVIGGYSDEDRTGVDTTFIYDPDSDTWQDGPSLHTPRSGHSAVILDDGRVFVVGGYEYGAVTTGTAEISSGVP